MITITYYPERESRSGNRVIVGAKIGDNPRARITLKKNKPITVDEQEYESIAGAFGFAALIEANVVEVTKPKRRTSKKDKTQKTNPAPELVDNTDSDTNPDPK